MNGWADLNAGRAIPASPAYRAGKDRRDFADFYREYDGLTQSHRPASVKWVCTGPITYDPTLLQIDIANFKAALAGVTVEEAFMPVAAPITVETDRRNEYYPSQEAYLYAIADALKQEYKAIVDAGFWSNWTIHGLPRVGTNCCPTSI